MTVFYTLMKSLINIQSPPHTVTVTVDFVLSIKEHQQIDCCQDKTQERDIFFS